MKTLYISTLCLWRWQTFLSPSPTLSLHGHLGVLHRLPGGGDVQEDGVGRVHHSEAVFAHVQVPDGDHVVHAVLSELLSHLLGPLLVELHCVQVASGGDGAQDGVGEGAAARPCSTENHKRGFRYFCTDLKELPLRSVIEVRIDTDLTIQQRCLGSRYYWYLDSYVFFLRFFFSGNAV